MLQFEITKHLDKQNTLNDQLKRSENSLQHMTNEVNELNAKFGHSLMFQDSHSDQLTRLQHAQDEAIGLHMQINRLEE